MSSSVESFSNFNWGRRKVLTSDSIVKRLLGKVAGLIGGVEDLVVENREIQCKTKTNGMSRSKIRRSNLSSSFVGFQ